MITLDGFFEGPNRDIGWHNVDDEFNEFAIEQLNSADGLIFGRVTYELMAAYWPTETVSTDDPIVAGKMNSIPKIVFSRTLEKAGWNNTRLVKDKAPEEISKLKQMPGRDLYIFGSAKLSSTLANLGLIDEYRVIVNPVVLGAGTPLFRDLQNPISLRLSRTKVFRNGNDLLVYQPDK
jgi:dihydrofolate reductase